MKAEAHRQQTERILQEQVPFILLRDCAACALCNSGRSKSGVIAWLWVFVSCAFRPLQAERIAERQRQMEAGRATKGRHR